MIARRFAVAAIGAIGRHPICWISACALVGYWLGMPR